MRKVLTGLAASLAASVLVPGHVQASREYGHYIAGKIVDITSIRGGILVRMDDDQVPSQCRGSGSAWMKIDQADTAMVSLMLTYWAQGKKEFTLYIESWSSGYCQIGQADPME